MADLRLSVITLAVIFAWDVLGETRLHQCSLAMSRSGRLAYRSILFGGMSLIIKYFSSCGRPGVPDLPAVRVALAVSLFRSASVSAGFAARMAGKPLAEMLTLLSNQGIPLTGNNKVAGDDARAEMRTGRDWLAKPAS